MWQVAEAAKRLADHRVSRVVTSPFARCLETTGALLDSLGLPWSCCSVDARFGEVRCNGACTYACPQHSSAVSSPYPGIDQRTRQTFPARRDVGALSQRCLARVWDGVAGGAEDEGWASSLGQVMDGSILARGAEVRPPEDALPAEWLWEGTSMEDAVREALPPGGLPMWCCYLRPVGLSEGRYQVPMTRHNQMHRAGQDRTMIFAFLHRLSGYIFTTRTDPQTTSKTSP